jgi:excinuclease UvrABC ATPase subunit
LIASYIHPGGRLGVLVEVNCETDFVARTEVFRNFVKEIAMQIAAANPLAVDREAVSSGHIEKEKEIYREQALSQGKPEKIVARGLIQVPEADKVFNPLTIMENLELGAYSRHPDRAELRQEIETIFHLFPILQERKDQPAGTLSGGEAQRIRLATQIGSGLMGVLYICDEPTVGLHPADDYRLIATLKRLRDLGNTIIVVEHDEAMMRAADHIIDMGPGAGEHGGWIVATGTIADIMNSKDSITGQYLSGAKQIPLPQKRRFGSGEEIVVKGAKQNNLKNIDVHIPLGKFVCVTGVSGSGKSTLIAEILYKKLAQLFYRSREQAGNCDAIIGVEHIDEV